MSDIKQYGAYFTFDDIQSNDFDVWISGVGTYDAPVRDMETITVPGRSGDLLIDNNRLNNIDITYPCYIGRQFDSRFDLFKAAMLSKVNYYVLRDTYHPDEYRLAYYLGGITPQTGAYNKSGSFDIVFHCKPQRYLNSGADAVTFTADGTITNPTRYTAKPLLRIYGDGIVTVGGYSVTVSSNSYEYIDVDCDTMDAYYGNSNANSYITVSGGFPSVAPGEATVTISGNITQIDITPRWWTV